MEPVVHFEMPYEDQKRLSAFYKSAFGWKMQATSPEMGDYVTAATSEPGPQGRPKLPGTINGGFFPKKPDWPAQVPSVVIGVGNIEKAMQKVSKAGGKVLGDPMEIPGIGRYVSFTDTEGNRVSLLEPAPMGKPAMPKAAAKKKAGKKDGKKKAVKTKAKK
jgi:predicted enzyme related to lactoylglutathione lyase